jgi:hypothetical protein
MHGQNNIKSYSGFLSDILGQVNRDFKMPRIIANILRNIARLFVSQLAVLRFQLPLVFFFAFKFIFSSVVFVCSELLHSRFTGGYRKAPAISFYWPVNVCLRGGSS